MRVFGENDLIQGFARGANSIHDGWMAMAMCDHPPGGDRIKDRPAIFIDEIGACCFDDSRHWRLQQMLGEKMPDSGAPSWGHYSFIFLKSGRSEHLLEQLWN